MKHSWRGSTEKGRADCLRCGLQRLVPERLEFDESGRRVFARYRYKNQAWRVSNPKCHNPNQEMLFGDVVVEREIEIQQEHNKKEDDSINRKYRWVPGEIREDELVREALRVFRGSEITTVKVPKRPVEEEEDDDLPF